MRILLVGDYPDDPRLGSGKVYHKLREELRRLGHECDTVLAPEIGPRPARARLRWAVGPVLAERAVRRAFEARGRYDVVDAASAEGAVIGGMRRMGRYEGVGLVSRSHGLEHLNYARMLDDHHAGLVPKPWTRRLWYPAARMSQVALAARLADRLIVLNPGDRAFAVERGWKAAGRIDLVPHGVSGGFLDAAPPPDAPRGRGLLFCGTWDPVKGADYLVRAMERLASDGDPPRLTVLGPGLSEELVLRAFPAGLRPRVTVVPRVGEDEVMRHYREHDALVMCSTYEGFGMVVVEAMSQRLPVVATPVGCAPMLIRDGDNGLLVPPRDADALARAIRRILADDTLRRTMAERAFETVRGMTWAATAARTVEVYEAAIQAARSAKP
ncbi:MAG TPA: glycosyltransferase family 4 protein [Longimicrobium sp.]|nr:glycosyltransferase family 4 protein [Longimicrobium sp.]